MQVVTRAMLKEMYYFVDRFCGGLARTADKGKEFHIYPDGSPAYPERHDIVGRFSNKRAWANDDEKYCYIFPDGDLAINEEYDGATTFIDGRAWVKKDGLWFPIALSGRRIGSPLPIAPYPWLESL